MSSVTLSRASGLALLLGSLLVLIGFVLRAFDPGINLTQEASALFVSSNVLVFSGIALLLFGWLGIVARLAELAGWLGLAGALLIFLSGVVFASIIGYNFLASPYYAVHAPTAAAQVAFGTPEAVVAAYVASSLFFGGAVLAEIAMLRARLSASRAGVLMVVAGVLALVFLFVLFSFVVSFIVFAVAVPLFVLGLAWMAYALLSAKGVSMSSVTLYRASGLALLLGLLLLLIGGVLRMRVPFIPTPSQEASALFVSSNVLTFSGIALLLFGWLGIVARLAELAGWLGLAGALLIFLSGVVIASIPAYNFLASPYYAVHAPTAAAQVAFGTPEVGVATYVAGSLAFGGAVLAEIAMLRARLSASRAGVLILIGAVLGLVFDFVIASPLVFAVAVPLFVLGLAWMAYALLSAKGETPRQPAPTP